MFLWLRFVVDNIKKIFYLPESQQQQNPTILVEKTKKKPVKKRGRPFGTAKKKGHVCLCRHEFESPRRIDIRLKREKK